MQILTGEKFRIPLGISSFATVIGINLHGKGNKVKKVYS